MSGLGLLCYKKNGSALAFKKGGSALIYKKRNSGGGGEGGGGETTRRITIDVLWDPINWTCEEPESHLMYGTVRCSVSGGTASRISQNYSSVGENTFRYEITEFPAMFTISIGLAAACVHGKFPEVTVSVVANCKTTEQYESTVQVPPSGSASKTVAVAVDASGNVSIA